MATSPAEVSPLQLKRLTGHPVLPQPCSPSATSKSFLYLMSRQNTLLQVMLG